MSVYLETDSMKVLVCLELEISWKLIQVPITCKNLGLF